MMMDAHGNYNDDYSSTMHSLVPVDYNHHQYQNEHHHQLVESSSSIDDHVIELSQLSASADWQSTSGMQQFTIALFDVNGLLDPAALCWMPHYFGASDQVDNAESDGTTIANPCHLMSGNGLHSHSEVAIDSSDGGPVRDYSTDAEESANQGSNHVTSCTTSTKPKKKMTKVTTFVAFTCAHCTGFKVEHRSMLMKHMNTVHPRECPLMLKGCVHRDGNDRNAACRRKVISTSWSCAHPDCSVRGPWKTKKSLQTHYHRYHEKGEYRCAKCVASSTFEYQNQVYAHAQDKHPTAKMVDSRGKSLAPKRNYPMKKKNYQRAVTLANGAKVECPWKDPRAGKLGKSAKLSVCGKSFATTGNMKRHFKVAHPEQYPTVKWERKKYIRKNTRRS